MMLGVSSFFIALVFISFANPCESLQCYECANASDQDCTSMVQTCPSCMIYRSDSNPTKFERRCCWWNCGADQTVSEFNGRPTYFCNSTDKCNGPENDALLGAVNLTTVTTSTTIPTTTVSVEKTISQCYECSGDGCGKEGSPTSNNCPSCMVFRSPSDQTKIERRCCWWNCGASNTVSIYEGIETYFCNGDKCNAEGVESTLSPPVITTTQSTISTTTATYTTVTTTAVTQKRPVQCYECSGPGCGKEGSPMSTNCPSCMAFRNPNDQTKIERRCCWWNCEPTNTVRMYEGIETYFCASDKCNAEGVESALSPPVITTTQSTVSTTTVTYTTVTTTVVTQKRPVQCYECSGPGCGKEGSPMSTNCPSCMAFRNPNDQTKIERRCCWWNCEPTNTIRIHEGIETYFCASDKCNAEGVESALSPPVTTTTLPTTTARATTTLPPTTTRATTTLPPTTTRVTTTLPTTTTASTSRPPTSSTCYECSGENCGKEGSAVASNCPSCMVYRNPNDQTKIERRCCWWNCGASNTVGMYNGMETYFCAGDKCNAYGVESMLSPPITTTTVSTVSTSTTKLITTTSASCVLNCQNSGIPETEEGCFCYCLENTYGQECEYIDCAKPDVDSETCSIENQPLCQESETFAFECHHLCGKC